MIRCAGKMEVRKLKNKHTVQIDTEKCIGCGLCQKRLLLSVGFELSGSGFCRIEISVIVS